jgi:lambda family phage portal protein
MKLFPSFFGKKDATEAPKRKFANAGAMLRMFAAGDANRLTADWGTVPMPADQIIRKHQRVLVARSREQVMNNDYARAYLRLASQNIVGPRGVVLQAQARNAKGELDQAANEAIELEFARWGRKVNCDVTGMKSWREFQRSAVRSACQNGEFFFRKVLGRAAGMYGFALQELDPQRCHPDFDENDIGGGRFIRAGIEFSEFGKPLAYYFEALKEGSRSDGFYSFGGRDFQRIPADEILHGFLPDMVSQKRGLPWMATGLFRMRQLNGLEDAAIVNARTGAAKMGFIEYEHGYGPSQDDDEDLEIEVEAGTFHQLPAGAKLSTFDTQFPSADFAAQVKVSLRGIASGLGVSYVSLANDLEGVNFSSIRQGTLDEREHWKELQEWLIESLHECVFSEWLPRALLAGHIKVNGKALPAANLHKYAVVTWQARRWSWIDPRADADAAVTSKNNLLKSPGAIIREDGQDPNAVYREIAADIKHMTDAGIPEKYIEMAMGMKLAPKPVDAAAANATAGA